MSLILPEIPNIPDTEKTPLVDLLLRVLADQRLFFETEINTLKGQISRLEKNSSNSSKPPSSDITSPKGEGRQRGKRKIGGQRGHKGSWRKNFRPEEVDVVKELKISHCPDCKILLEESNEVRIHQQAELVENPVRVTEYQFYFLL